MADARTPASGKRTTTSRGSNGSGQRSRSGSAQKSRSGSAQSRSRSASAQSRSGSASASEPAQASRNGSSNAVVITGLATAAAGVVGGVILGKRLSDRPRHILGVRVPGSGAGMNELLKQVKRSGKHVRTAGKQIAELTDEVRAAREKAEEIGRVIS